MTLAVQPEQRAAFEALAKQRDVEVAFMGTFNDSGYFTVKQEGVVVASLDMNFLYEDGCPTLDIPAVWKAPRVEAPVVPETADFREVILALLSDLNLCSREYKSRMYDGEVKGLSVVKPFVGAQADVPSDATVLRVDYQSHRGAVLAEGINPWYSDLDTYAMTTSVIDEAVRRIIAVGGELERIAILDNFCWPDPVESEKTPDGAYKMAQLVRSCQALYDLTTLYKTPAVSGKDSCKNDSTRGGKKISIPPTLLISSVGQMADVSNAVTMPFKAAGDLIYVIGETKAELGASSYYRWLAEAQGTPEAMGGQVPEVNGEQALSIYRAMNGATQQGSCSRQQRHRRWISFAVALPIGSEHGAQIDLSGVSSDANIALFSESNSRFVISVKPEEQAALETLFEGLPLTPIGRVTAGEALTIQGLATLDRETMRTAFKETLAGV